MGMTIAQKIIARASGRDAVEPDEVLWVDVDLAMMHDSSGPRRIWPALERLGVTIHSREPALVSTNRHSADYLETKRERMGHTLPEQLAGAFSDAE